MTTQDDQTIQTEITTQIAEVAPPPEVAPAEPAPKQSMRDQIESETKKLLDRPRDEAGRFALKQAEDAAKAAAKTAEQAPIQPAPIKPVAKVERPADMPKAWGADKATHWATLTPEAKAYITEREAQMEGLHSKVGGLNKWAEAAAQNNTTLPEVLERVSNVENTMIENPSQGFIMAGEMVGLGKEDTARALIGALQMLGYQIPGVQQSPQAQQRQPAYDPEIQTLKQELASIKGHFQSEALSKAQAAVEAFFADPANKHAKTVEAEIASELKAMQALGKPMDLKTAYERALWTRPDLREQLIAEKLAETQAKAQATTAQALEKSRSASRSVAGSPPLADGRATGEKPIALRAQLEQKLAALGGRV